MMKNILLFASISFLILSVGCKEDSKVLSLDEQFAIDVDIIDNYLEVNNIAAEIHESGIRYVEEVVGTGESPSSSTGVIVKYEASFLDGTFFDNNSLGINFDLSTLIEAWKQMIPEMKEGGKMTIYAPSVYCYGNADSNNQGIPPNSILVFEIELLSLVRPFNEQLEIDKVIIDNYLTENSIEFQIHSSGIRYQTLIEGTGLNPALTDLVRVNYVGKFFDGEIFDEDQNASVQLNNLIDAWKTMLPTIQEDGKIVIYAPSGYCYGNIGNGVSIAPNTNLVFEIELISIN